MSTLLIVSNNFRFAHRQAYIFIIICNMHYTLQFKQQNDILYQKQCFIFPFALVYLFWFGLFLYTQVNNFGHFGMVRSPYFSFFLAKLEQVVIICCHENTSADHIYKNGTSYVSRFPSK